MSVNPNFTNANANTSFFAAAGGGGGGSIPDPLNISTLNAVAITSKTVSTSNYFPSTTPNLLSMDNYMLVQNNSQGGRNSIRTTWDATDSGAVVSCVMGSDGTRGTAFIGSEWPGYITMPMTMYGANITLESDNETFFFMDGKSGAIGNISTGTQLLSASNIFNTITDPTKVYTADMTALLSTLAATYPACFI